MWVLPWRLWPTKATQLRAPEGGSLQKPASQHGVITKAGGLVFLTSTKHEFSPLPLDCTFQFLTIPVDYCSCDSPQVPEPSSHILGPVFAPAYCDLFLRLESEQADSPAGRAQDGDHTDFLYKYEC